MRYTFVRASAVCLGISLAALVAGPGLAHAQCFTLSSASGVYLTNDLCGSTVESDYQTRGAYKNAVVKEGSDFYLLYGYPNSLDVFKVTAPMSPMKLTNMVQFPWSPDPGGSTHEGIVDHLRKFVVLDDYQYAWVGMFTYGWDFFDVVNQKYMGLGYGPAKVLAVSQGRLSAALFRAGGRVYLAGQALDQASITAGDTSIKIFDVTTPQSFSTMTPVATVPIGHSGDPAPYNSFVLGAPSSLVLDVFTAGGRTYLSAKNTIDTTAAVIVDVTSPTIDPRTLSGGPVPVAYWSSTTGADPRQWEGAWAFDGNATPPRLYVQTLRNPVIYGFNLTLPPATSPTDPPVYQWTSDLWGPAGQLNISNLKLSGSLLMAWSGYNIGYFSVQGSGPPLLIPGTTGDNVTNLVNSCNGAYSVSAQTLSGFTVPSDPLNVYVARSLLVYGDVLKISQSCMSTTPKPNITLVRTSSGNIDPTCTGGDARGYPGDIFTVSDISLGSPVTRVLSVNPNLGTISGASPTWTWAAPANVTGNFTFTLTETDSAGLVYTSTALNNDKIAALCSSPTAGAQVTGVQLQSTGPWNTTPPWTYLTGDTVQLSAAAPSISLGNPISYAWSVQDTGGTWGAAQTGPTINVPLASAGTYNAFVAVQYGFPGIPDPRSCAKAPATLPLSTTNYTSCAALPLLSNPFSVSGITVSDGISTATVATNGTPPTFLRGNPITFSATYRVASTYTPSFVWGFKNSSATPAPTADWTSTPGTVKGVIPAGTLPVATGDNAEFTQAIATPPVGNPVDLTSSVAAVNFNVTDCQPAGVATPTAPANNASAGTAPVSVTFQWTGPTTGTPPFTYAVKDPSGFVAPYCSTTNGALTCSFTATAAGTYYWAVFTSSACGGAVSQSPTFSFTVASSGGGGGGGAASLAITPSPVSPFAGSPVTIYINPATSASGDSVLLYFGDGQSGTISYDPLLRVGSNSIVHTYATAGTFSIVASGIAGGVAVSGTKSIIVTSNCALPNPPTASFTFTPTQPRAGQAVAFTDTSSGGPTSWSWNFGDGIPPLVAGHTSTQPNPTLAYSTPGTYTVTLTATNCKGSSVATQQITVLSACAQTAPPTPNFTWSPTGPLAGFPEQQQPYVGQTVTLTDASTGSPTSWQWHDFEELMVPPTTVTVPTFTATWTIPGDKNVRMTATNCFGASGELLKVVHVYQDVRHVVADFTWGDAPLTTGAPVTLVAAQGPANGDPDTFAWTFDDGGTPQSGASVTHTFTCAGQHTVTLTASRADYPSSAQTTPHALTIGGQQCGPVAVMTVDAAKLNGINGTSWRTDVRIFNPAAQSSKVTVEFLPINQGSPSGSGEFTTLLPNATWVLDDILGSALTQGFVAAGVNKAALRFTYDNTGDTAPVVVSDTYTSPPSGGGRYGQLTPGVEVVPTTTPPVLWITGIRNNGTTTGFRTNYSLVNLRSDAGVQGLKFTLFDPTGTAVASQTVSMNALEYRQDSLANLFGGAAAAVSQDPLAVKVEVPAGTDVQAYASVMDNLTGDPVLIPAVPPPASPIFLPAVGHTPGVNGTVWRSDLQITNPDTVPHTWEIKYLPKSGDSQPGVFRQVTLAAHATQRMDDLLSWAFSGLLPADASTSGVARIAPADGTQVYPIVQARSFNQTANGTFGQNITPITAEMGVAAGQGKRLLLTGMSSEDVARTNLGFVNLSDDSSVAFAVTFYDENGKVLNPLDGQRSPIPYTASLGIGGWDQDKLENRFKNTTGWPALGANLRAISAVIEVTGGGPGTVYATVIDSQTGDPNFILAQPAP